MEKYLELQISSKDATSSTYSFFFSLLNLFLLSCVLAVHACPIIKDGFYLKRVVVYIVYYVDFMRDDGRVRERRVISLSDILTLKASFSTASVAERFSWLTASSVQFPGRKKCLYGLHIILFYAICGILCVSMTPATYNFASTKLRPKNRKKTVIIWMMYIP